jgi:hypothetical protein
MLELTLDDRADEARRRSRPAALIDDRRRHGRRGEGDDEAMSGDQALMARSGTRHRPPQQSHDRADPGPARDQLPTVFFVVGAGPLRRTDCTVAHPEGLPKLARAPICWRRASSAARPGAR